MVLICCLTCLVVLAVWLFWLFGRLGEILRPPDLWIGVALGKLAANKMGLGTSIDSSRDDNSFIAGHACDE